jgi:hypothetical protein
MAHFWGGGGGDNDYGGGKVDIDKDTKVYNSGP